MPGALLEYVEHAHLRGGPIPVPSGARPDPLHAILVLLSTREGHDFRCYKKPMLLRRIQRRMGLNRIAAIADYAQHLRDTPAELKALAKDLLIGVTEFFREPEAWAVLEAEVTPQLVAAKHLEAPIRVWVAGCATGEEAYSIGMCLLERVASSERNGKLQIFATDIDRHALEMARAGIYPEIREITQTDAFALPYWDWYRSVSIPAAFARRTVGGRSNDLWNLCKSPRSDR
ncbi:MAG: CheR family methyltransferase [Gammaproteobacteria bacterium]